MLSAAQKRHLRALAHHLRPVVALGARGLTDAVLAELDGALAHHELVKIKLGTGDRDARASLLQTICQRVDAEAVQSIGRTATLFRRNPDAPRIRLP